MFKMSTVGRYTCPHKKLYELTSLKCIKVNSLSWATPSHEANLLKARPAKAVATNHGCWASMTSDASQHLLVPNYTALHDERQQSARNMPKGFMQHVMDQ